MTDSDQLVRDNRRAFAQLFGQAPAVTAIAPGRINIIGEHTDYSGGLAMPGAIDRWTVISLRPRGDRRVTVHSEHFGASISWQLGDTDRPRASWATRLFGLVEVFSRHRKLRRGLDALISGNLPVGAGLSSSAAVGVAMMNALRAGYGAELDDLGLVLDCQRVEHEFLGIGSGLLDQYASQFSRSGMLMVVDFDRLCHTYLEIEPGGWRWVLVDTLVRRELATSAYLERVAETRRALGSLRAREPALSTLRDIGEDHVALLDDRRLRRRLRHFLAENARVRETASLLAAGRWSEVGRLLTASHESLQRDYEVSCAELDMLVESALQVPGCLGSRLMGGGFGGCTINLVDERRLGDFAARVCEAYRERFGRRPEVNAYRLSSGAAIV